MSNKPETVKELFEFYYEQFKPLYCHLESLAQPPTEMLFEINAAFDHLSRHWQYGEDEKTVVSTVCAHLKRGCFDAFKIILRDTRSHYDHLFKIDTSIIDCGEYDSKMLGLWAEIKAGAVAGRLAEGDSRDKNSWHAAFDLWQPVYVNCVKFDQEFFLNPKVEWARKKQGRSKWATRIEGFVSGVIASLIAAVVWHCCTLTPKPTTDLKAQKPTTQATSSPSPVLTGLSLPPRE